MKFFTLKVELLILNGVGQEHKTSCLFIHQFREKFENFGNSTNKSVLVIFQMS